MQLANTVYHKGVGQIVKSRKITDVILSDVYDNTHPLLSHEDVLIADADSKLNIIYAERQAMLVAFVQLFEWLMQDDESIVPFTPNFVGFQGRIRLPALWVETLVLESRWIWAQPVEERAGLPPIQFASNIHSNSGISKAVQSVAPVKVPAKAALYYRNGFSEELCDETPSSSSERMSGFRPGGLGRWP